jgi:hypothetical protein
MPITGGLGFQHMNFGGTPTFRTLHELTICYSQDISLLVIGPNFFVFGGQYVIERC